MRTLVDLTGRQVEQLDLLARQQKASRAALIRHAIDDYLVRHKSDEGSVFGLWKDRNVDALDYLEKIRSEW